MNQIWIRKEDELFLVNRVSILDRGNRFDMIGVYNKEAYDLYSTDNKRYLEIKLNQIQEAIINKESVYSL